MVPGDLSLTTWLASTDWPGLTAHTPADELSENSFFLVNADVTGELNLSDADGPGDCGIPEATQDFHVNTD